MCMSGMIVLMFWFIPNLRKKAQLAQGLLTNRALQNAFRIIALGDIPASTTTSHS